jgi:NAD dependent epimerase/dehydratase family enzyme
MKTALIIGGTGLIGKSLINLLKAVFMIKLLLLAKENQLKHPKLE